MGTPAFATFLHLFAGLVRNRAWRDASELVRAQPWQPVEVPVDDAGCRGQGKRTVLLVGRWTGWPSCAMAVEQGGERGWLQPTDRGWFLHAMSSNGKRALLAPPDRRAFALLEERKPDLAHAWPADHLGRP